MNEIKIKIEILLKMIVAHSRSHVHPPSEPKDRWVADNC